MFKTICSKCKGPRELDSTNLSWCKNCTRIYQRNRYRDQREAAGLRVTPRVQPAAQESTTPATADAWWPSESDLREHRVIGQVIDKHNNSPAEGESGILVCNICKQDIPEDTEAFPLIKLTNYVNSEERTSHFKKTDLIKGVLCPECSEIAETFIRIGAARVNLILRTLLSVSTTVQIATTDG
jgi:hypothetical protein